MRVAPGRLETDSVAEAMVDIQFASDDVPELVLGRLVSGPQFQGFSVIRLPLADVPLGIRQNDSNLATQPTLELRKPDGTRAARVGERVLTWHCLPPYPGWQVFDAEIESNLDFIYNNIRDVKITRLGLKYINALSHRHGVNGIKELDMDIKISGKELNLPFNLNYMRYISASHSILTKVATKEWVQHPSMPLAVVVDIDVSPTASFYIENNEKAKEWINVAHEAAKSEFFSFLSAEVLEKMRGSA